MAGMSQSPIPTNLGMQRQKSEAGRHVWGQADLLTGAKIPTGGKMVVAALMLGTSQAPN